MDLCMCILMLLVVVIFTSRSSTLLVLLQSIFMRMVELFLRLIFSYVRIPDSCFNMDECGHVWYGVVCLLVSQSVLLLRKRKRDIIQSPFVWA